MRESVAIGFDLEVSHALPVEDQRRFFSESSGGFFKKRLELQLLLRIAQISTD
jgi:hypothetical protein